MIETRTSINGRPWSGELPPRLTLADFLRDQVRLTGTHLGCEQGVCGACTVLVDGQPVRSCLLFAVQVDDSEVTTVEGLTPAEGLSPLQQAFEKHHAFQCGFCTPGFLVAAEAILRSGARPDRAELRRLLSGNLCRCTGYEPILQAVESCL